MDKMIDVPSFTHVIKLNDRKNIIISGIKKINSCLDLEKNRAERDVSLQWKEEKRKKFFPQKFSMEKIYK